jgi:peptidoglycan/LPS O-acetylase OafA/YrhL
MTAQQVSRSTHHLAELDGIRAIAVSLVLLSHTAETWFPGGWIGVDLFFVLSGFLITSVLLRERWKTGRISLRNFYVRRTLRLMPALVVLLVVYSVIPPFRNLPGHFWPVLFSAFYVMDWVEAFDLGPQQYLPHTWSLGVEEQFYLLWPAVLIFLLPRFKLRGRLLVLTGIIVVIVAWRTGLIIEGASGQRTYYAFDTRLDTILIGCALALWLAEGKASSRLAFIAAKAAPWLMAAVFAIAVMYETQPDLNAGHSLFLNTIGFTLLACLCAAIILGAVNGDPQTMMNVVLASAPLVYLGRISYGVYLWHYPVLAFLTNIRNPWLMVASTFLLSIAVASVSFFLLERPFLRLKERFSAIDDSFPVQSEEIVPSAPSTIPKSA